VKNSSGSFAENSAPFGRSEGFVADDPRWPKTSRENARKHWLRRPTLSAAREIGDRLT
jgi:hypothetical protein